MTGLQINLGKYWVAICLTTIVSSACQDRRTADLPAIPEVSTSGMLRVIQQQIDTARTNVIQDPTDAAANGRLGMILAAYERDESALPCFRRAQILAPDEFRWPFYSGFILARLGRFEESLAPLQAALRLEPDSVGARFVRAKSLDALGRYDEARSGYEGVIADAPRRVDAIHALAQLLQKMGETEAAIDKLQSALEIGGHNGPLHYALAGAFRALGDSENAQTHLALYEEHKTNTIIVDDALLSELHALKISDQQYITRGAQLFAAGELRQAAIAFEDALSLNPGNSSAHASLVGVYHRLQEPNRATEHYRRAIELDPNQPDAHFNFGTMLFQQGRLDRAVDVLKQAATSDPTNIDVLVRLGYALDLTGDAEASMTYLKAALALDDSDRLANYLLGRRLVASNQLAQGIVYLERTRGVSDRSSAVYLQELGNAYRKDGRIDLGLATLQEARDAAVKFGSTQVLLQIDKDITLLEAGESE